MGSSVCASHCSMLRMAGSRNSASSTPVTPPLQNEMSQAKLWAERCLVVLMALSLLTPLWEGPLRGQGHSLKLVTRL